MPALDVDVNVRNMSTLDMDLYNNNNKDIYIALKLHTTEGHAQSA